MGRRDTVKRYVPALGISLERNTEAVPQNDQFHILKNGVIVASYRSHKQAVEHYTKLIEEAGGTLKQNLTPVTAEERRQMLVLEDTNRNLELSDLYWGAAGGKHKGKKHQS